MQSRLSITLSVSLLIVGLAACGKKPKPVPESGSGSTVVVTPPVGSGAAGSGSATPWGTNFGGSGSDVKWVVGAEEKIVGKSSQLAVIELTSKATPTTRLFAIRGAKDGFTIEVGGGAADKDKPVVGLFPLKAPGDRNMNSTTVSFAYPNGSIMLTVASFDEISKTDVKPEQIATAFDRARADALDSLSAKLDKETTDSIANAPGRTITFNGETSGKKTAGKIWMVFAAKSNVYVEFQVLAPAGDPLFAEADGMMKTLTIGR